MKTDPQLLSYAIYKQTDKQTSTVKTVPMLTVAEVINKLH